MPGLFKDEYSGKIIAEFIGLKPKMYSILKAGDDPLVPNPDPKVTYRKAKGVPKSLVKNMFNHERYRKVLDKKILNDVVSFNTIRSEKHKFYTMRVVKVGCSPIDTKKYILLDGIHTYAYGDYRIIIKTRGAI